MEGRMEGGEGWSEVEEVSMQIARHRNLKLN